MAYVARLSDYVRGGVVAQNLQEGRAVVLGPSDGSRNELPTLVTADADTVRNVFILFKNPDDFARPTNANMYTAPAMRVVNFNSGFQEPIHTETMYDVGKSTLWNPTLVAGELGQAQRGGTYAVPAGAFTDVADIRVPGAEIAVGAGGVWVLAAEGGANAVGMVEEYNEVNQVLIFTLWH